MAETCCVKLSCMMNNYLATLEYVFIEISRYHVDWGCTDINVKHEIEQITLITNDQHITCNSLKRTNYEDFDTPQKNLKMKSMAKSHTDGRGNGQQNEEITIMTTTLIITTTTTTTITIAIRLMMLLLMMPRKSLSTCQCININLHCLFQENFVGYMHSLTQPRKQDSRYLGSYIYICVHTASHLTA